MRNQKRIKSKYPIATQTQENLFIQTIMNDTIKKIALSGYISKGIVFSITGILAFLSAFNMGGRKAGKISIISYLEQQTLGSVIVVLLGVGLICYGIWRLIQGVNDPEGIGTDFKGLVKRISFSISGIIYFLLGLIAIAEAFGLLSIYSTGNNSKEPLLNTSTRSLIFIIIGGALAIKAIYQFVKIYKGNFINNFDIQSVTSLNTRKYIKRMGYAGLLSRGIVTSIISYFFLSTGIDLNASSKQVKGTAEAFSFIQDQAYGKYLLGFVAAGLVCYGLFMFSTAAYRKYND